MIPGSRLQDGIYLQRGVPPLAAWRALFLDIAPTTPPGEARDAVARVHTVLTELRAGIIRDLGPAAPPDTFDMLTGFGVSFFEESRHEPRLTRRERPANLVRLRRDGPAFPAIGWSSAPNAATRCSGEADLLLQLTGVSDHAVSRAAVEVCNLIDDDHLPLTVVGTYDGFLRDDGRSWLGFHDGISNIEPSQRSDAVTCVGDPDWNTGGTYLAYLRLDIAIKSWRGISRPEQELIVGRDKLDGWPIAAVRVKDGRRIPEPLSSGPLTDATPWQLRDAFFNPPDTGCPILEASHTHRTNQNKAAATTPSGHRIFRQGYEYLEDINPTGPRLGLNFVSFQNDLMHVQQILGLKGWLGDTDFGGAGTSAQAAAAAALLELTAGGYYVVPPRHISFPGADLFDTS